jgi:hypothetical protein
VVYPKGDLLNAPFQPGDRFAHQDAAFDVKVLKKKKDGSYLIEVDVQAGTRADAGIKKDAP